MPTPESRTDQMHRILTSGVSTQTVITTATQLWDMTADETNQALTKVKVKLAIEGTALDIVAELMLKLRQQEHALDLMSRELKRDDLPASFFDTHRKLTKDCITTLLAIADRREKEGRNACQPPEKEAQREKEEIEYADRHMKNLETQRDVGYFYEPRHALLQPASELTSLPLAIRDVIRMRMLPKSPYEDHIIAQAFDALSEEEKKIDPETLSKEEREVDLHQWDPEVHATPGRTRYDEFSELTRRIYLERLTEYNKIWAQAEAHVDGLMALKGISPRFRPYVGIPPLVRKAAEGDQQAIAELNEVIAVASGRASAPRVSQHTPEDLSLDLGKPCSIIIAILLAFTCAWTCVTLITTPTPIDFVMNLEPTETVGCCRAYPVEEPSNVQHPARRTEAPPTPDGARFISIAPILPPVQRSSHPMFSPIFSTTPYPTG